MIVNYLFVINYNYFNSKPYHLTRVLGMPLIESFSFNILLSSKINFERILQQMATSLDNIRVLLKGKYSMCIRLYCYQLTYCHKKSFYFISQLLNFNGVSSIEAILY